MYSTAEWTKFAPVVDHAINGHAAADDLASLQAIAERADIKIPAIIADLFERPIAHEGVVAQADIEAEILAFLRG